MQQYRRYWSIKRPVPSQQATLSPGLQPGTACYSLVASKTKFAAAVTIAWSEYCKASLVRYGFAERLHCCSQGCIPAAMYLFCLEALRLFLVLGFSTAIADRNDRRGGGGRRLQAARCRGVRARWFGRGVSCATGIRIKINYHQCEYRRRHHGLIVQAGADGSSTRSSRGSLGRRGTLR